MTSMTDVTERNALKAHLARLDRLNLIGEMAACIGHEIRNPLIERSNQKLNDIVKSIRPLIEADAVSQGKSIITELSEGIPCTSLDDKKIRQFILNLVRNALEAMELGEMVYIRTYVEENKVVLAVQDEGKGIPEHIYANLGMLFNTSKENGTGLGLPVCCRIIERHEAVINVQTGPDGTEFIISFHPVKGIDPSDS